MRMRRLGRTGIEVSEVGFGAWAIGGPWTLGEKQVGWGDVDDRQSLAALHAAHDAGITFFDTADCYGWGHSEELVGQAFAGRRDQVVIATKFGNKVVDGQWVKDYSPAYARQAIDASLQRLGTDHVDLYQVHSPRAGFVFTDDLWAALDDVVAAGKARHAGVSVGPWDQGFAVIDAGHAETIQVIMSILHAEPADGGLLDRAKDADVGIIPRVPLASGFLTGRFRPGHTFAPNDHRSSLSREEIDGQIERVERLRPIAAQRGQTMAQLALSWLLRHDAISVVIPGAKTVAQVQDNATAGDTPLLTQAEMQAIAEAVA